MERLDLRSLKDLFGSDAMAETRFLDVLLKTNLGDLVALRALFASNSFRDAAACVHRIKGAAGIVKASGVVRACEAAEAAFRMGNKTAMALAVEALCAALQQLNEAIWMELQVLVAA
jgi:HPt (histidine-containing phosphotransfer) domain-containing protein